MESFDNAPTPSQEDEVKIENPMQVTPEISEGLDPKQEKIKELTETVDFWIGQAKSGISYMNEIYDVQKMGEEVQRLGNAAGSPNEKTSFAGRYNWVKSKLELYSAMIPALTEAKKALDEGELEYPWGVSVEKDVEMWNRRGNNY